MPASLNGQTIFCFASKNVAGLLIETHISEGFIKEAIVGVGLNVNARRWIQRR
jgi:biotin-(acetyl-CoA carboxylase) ligase